MAFRFVTQLKALYATEDDQVDNNYECSNVEMAKLEQLHSTPDTLADIWYNPDILIVLYNHYMIPIALSSILTFSARSTAEIDWIINSYPKNIINTGNMIISGFPDKDDKPTFIVYDRCLFQLIFQDKPNSYKDGLEQFIKALPERKNIYLPVTLEADEHTIDYPFLNKLMYNWQMAYGGSLRVGRFVQYSIPSMSRHHFDIEVYKSYKKDRAIRDAIIAFVSETDNKHNSSWRSMTSNKLFEPRLLCVIFDFMVAMPDWMQPD